MDETYDLYVVPGDLPAPQDDGAADHLPGTVMPSVPLEATNGQLVDLSALPGRTVVYAFPRTGRPDEPGSSDWDAIPGARGCTPQSCGFRDHFTELRALGAAAVYGLSTQTPAYQREAVDRLRLPFSLLSDSALRLTAALRLPTFQFDPYEGESPTHLRRLAMVLRDGVIEKVFYPVFPADRNAADVARWLLDHPM